MDETGTEAGVGSGMPRGRLEREQDYLHYRAQFMTLQQQQGLMLELIWQVLEDVNEALRDKPTGWTVTGT